MPETLLINDKYSAISLIGEGQFSQVYKAIENATGQIVALKVLKPNWTMDSDAVQRLLRERDVLCSINHPYVARLLEVGQSEYGIFLILEYCHGGSLLTHKDHLHVKLEWKEKLALLIQASLGLQAVHDSEIIHRDIKPSNILLTLDNCAKISDFGLAYINSGKRLTRTGEIVGTLEYMSPERIEDREINNLSDIFSMGATAYEFLTGRSYLPFTGNLVSDIRLIVDRWGIVPPSKLEPELPEKLDDVILQALAYSPNQRQQTAKEFAFDLLNTLPEDFLEDFNTSDIKSFLEGIEPGNKTKKSRIDFITPQFSVETIPSGVLSLDIAFGVMGFPRRHIVEIFGPESSGKTTLVMSAIAQAQLNGGTAAYIDADHAMSPIIASRCKVDVGSLYYAASNVMEDVLQIVHDLICTNAFDIIAVDSIAALISRATIEDDLVNHTDHRYYEFQIVRRALQKILVDIEKSRTCLIFTNQLEEKQGVMFGNPETTPLSTGSLKYNASLRIDMRRVQSIKLGSEIIGNRVRVRIVKNRVGDPFRSSEFDIMYEYGVDTVGDLADLALQLEVIIGRKGGIYKFEDINLGRSRASYVKFIRSNDIIQEKIKSKVIEKVSTGNYSELFRKKTPTKQKTTK